MADLDFQIDVPIGDAWDTAALLRASVLNCLSAIFRNNEFSTMVSTTVGELIENAIKYGDWSNPDRSNFHLHVHGDTERVHVEVSNPISSSNANVDRLLRMIEWLRGFSSPGDAYVARMMEVASTDDGTSGLGLARIAYEGNCELDASLDVERRILCVRATARA